MAKAIVAVYVSLIKKGLRAIDKIDPAIRDEVAMNFPVAWSTGMTCSNGTYYTYAGEMYKCIKDSGIELVYTPDQLVGSYFVKV